MRESITEKLSTSKYKQTPASTFQQPYQKLTIWRFTYGVDSMAFSFKPVLFATLSELPSFQNRRELSSHISNYGFTCDRG